MARCTRARISGRTWAYWLRTRDTVAGETRARRATSATVGGQRCFRGSGTGPALGGRVETGFKNGGTLAEIRRTCQAERRLRSRAARAVDVFQRPATERRCACIASTGCVCQAAQSSSSRAAACRIAGTGCNATTRMPTRVTDTATCCSPYEGIRVRRARLPGCVSPARRLNIRWTANIQR